MPLTRSAFTLVELLLVIASAAILWFCAAARSCLATDMAAAKNRVPLSDNQHAWQCLPPVRHGANKTLPVWALALADTLPRTTAAMLELDYLQRACGPLDPLLRGQIRWIVAHANHCPYGEAYALADMRRGGASAADITMLRGDLGKFPLPRRRALVFARRLSQAGHTVTDEAVAELIQAYGEEKVVALVMLVAYASFQDRLLVALDLPLETGGPLPPLDVRFAASRLGSDVVQTSRQTKTLGQKVVPTPPRQREPEATTLDFEELHRALAKQRQRSARIQLPAQYKRGMQWWFVCHHYQPELAGAWSACTEAFAAETDQEPMFAQSLFRIITQEVRCFY